MEKINDEQLKREFAFDQYGRYAAIRDIVNKNRKEGEIFKVLDVGGRGNIMKKFLPNDNVFYLDPFIDSGDDNFIKGDGCAMSFNDGDFDWVTSADVFEHIPKEKRDAFLEENIRVAKLGVVLVAPFYSKEIAQAEINANENHKTLTEGSNHLWLKEHIENKLPKESDIERFLEERKYCFQKVNNNDLFLWQLLTGISFNFDQNILRDEYEDLNYFYNTNIPLYGNDGVSYRKIFFIKKDKSLNDIAIENNNVDKSIYALEVVKRAMDLIAMNNNLNKVNFQENCLEINDLNKIIQKKEQEISNLNLVVQQKDLEIELVTRSKFWKLRSIYLKMKNYGKK